MSKKIIPPVLAGLFLFFLLACGPESARQPASPPKTDSPEKEESVEGSFSDQQFLRIDSSGFSLFFKKFPDLKIYAGDLRLFYQYRRYRYAWYDSSGLTEQANLLFDRLNNLQVEGLSARVPYIHLLDSIMDDPSYSEKPDSSLELLLSAEYLFYGDKVWKGIAENDTKKLEWFLPRKKIDLPYLADSLISRKSDSLFTENYSNDQYNLLKKQLQFYRQLDRAEPWQAIAGIKGSFKRNDSSAEIGQIRKKLYLLGDLKTNSGTDLFDEELETAVSSFQYRYGLPQDGVAGPAFIRYLNVPLKEQIRKIIVNMERMRWIPVNISHHFLLINIPSFTLYAYDQDTVSFTMNVVVGKDLHKTVLFSGDIRYIVFSPYWNVPASILKNEILPAIKRDPDYLRRNNMEWSGNQVRQKPGPKNSLGLVKFLFPNSYNIYLHDSPAKSLFQQTNRAFSHGCIRLAEPEKLANYLLKDDSKWSGKSISQAMHAGVEKYVTLKNPIPVYIGYLTAFVDRMGRISFRDDIYQRDLPLEKMIIR